MKRIMLVCFVLIVEILLISCGIKDNRDLTNGNEEGLDYVDFLKLLTGEGFHYNKVDGEPAGVLSVESRAVFIGDELITVYEYDKNEAMEQDSGYIHPGGKSISYQGR